MKKILSILLIFALVVPTGCTRREPEPSIGMESSPGIEATVGTAPTIPTGAAETVPDPTGTEPEQPTVPVSAPVTTEPSEPTAPSSTGAPKPKPTEPAPQPTEPTPKPTEPSHRHSYTTQVVAPTCTQQGYTVDVCGCGAKTSPHDYTPALGHDYQVTGEQEATPWSSGYRIMTCTRCGDIQQTETGKLTDAQIEAYRYEVAKAAIKYINQYRAEAGSTQLTYLPGMTEVVMYRSKQLITNFTHSPSDDQIALALFQYGTPVTYEDFYMDMETGELVYTGEMVTEWKLDGACREAIGKINTYPTADAAGKRIAEKIRGSDGHWAYIGDAQYSFAGAGWTPEGYWAFWVSEKNND